MPARLHTHSIVAAFLLALGGGITDAQLDPGQRSLLSAHNCYPYHGLWGDRIDRAISTGYPLSIEIDLCWGVPDGESQSRSIIAHGGPFAGDEPTLDSYFFERVRADIERSIARAQLDPREKELWPMIVLDLDIKDDSSEHIRSIYQQLMAYVDWLCTAPRLESVHDQGVIEVRPVLVLMTGTANQQRVFHDELEIGMPIIGFGRALTSSPDTSGMPDSDAEEARASYPAELMLTEPASNYRRWWNNSWDVVEAGGATKCGEWTPEDRERLHSLVDHAHRMGYLIRFYTINGHSNTDAAIWGYGTGYNTGSIEDARIRWKALVEARVDLIATDQYTLFDSLHDSISR